MAEDRDIRRGEAAPRAGDEQGDVNTGMLRERYWQRNLSPAAREIHERDQRFFLRQNLSTPVLNVLSRARGIYVEDFQGRRYIDMHGNGVHNAGFNNPEVVRAVREQLDAQLTFCPRRYTNEPAVRLAEKLARITPEGLEKSLFCPGGSEAIEMAITLARQVTGRYKTISFWNSFHGAGFAAASVGGEALFRSLPGPMMPGSLHVEFPDYYRNPWGFSLQSEVDAECLRQMELVFQKEPGIACVVAEPVSAVPVVPTRGYWRGVRDLCRRYGALLIFDEIIEGFGRTGKMFACQHSVTPDILVLGKSLGGGLLPFAGIVARPEHDVCPHLSVGHYTHEKNALCAAAALAEIEFLENHRLPQHAAGLGQYALSRLEEMKARHKLIGNVTGIGLHLGLELVKGSDAGERAVGEAGMVMYRCMEKGLAFKIMEGNRITLRPALVITKPELERALHILDEAIGEVEAGQGYA